MSGCQKPWNKKGVVQGDNSGLITELSTEYVLDNHRSIPKYSLNNINFILLKDGKFYNLLEKMSHKRRIRCGCVKSNCNAKYCQCFRGGETCGEDCSCLDCNNRKPNFSVAIRERVQSFSCKCIKSGCLKKYCECYQKERKCNSECCCTQCRNLQQIPKK